MITTLIHPSRQRAKKAFETHAAWNARAVNKDIQYILSLDNDDPELEQYKSLFDCHILINDNNNLVQAVHQTIPYIKGDLVVVVSDDFDCPDKWDLLLLEEISSPDYAIYVNDGCSFGRRVMTLPIVSKSVVDKLGYIYYPEYTGMFADDDLYQVCEAMGVLIKKNIVFEHKHYTQKKSPNDSTYKRHNTKESWDLGKSILARRRASNFNL